MKHGETGFCCGDLVQFARRAARLLRHAGRRQSFSESARRYALTRSWADALEPLYRAYTSPPLCESAASHAPPERSRRRQPFEKEIPAVSSPPVLG